MRKKVKKLKQIQIFKIQKKLWKFEISNNKLIFLI